MYGLVLFVAIVAVCSGFRSTFYRPSCTLRSSLHMNLADRFFRVVKSNVNSIISNLEDPEKVLDQAVNDMQNDLVRHKFRPYPSPGPLSSFTLPSPSSSLRNIYQSHQVKVRQSYAEISATQKRMEKQKEAATNLADDWYKRAQLALSKGDEELAREALSRRQIQTTVADDLEKQLTLQASALDKLYNSMTQLEAKIMDAKRQKDAMIARARTAKTSVAVNDMLSSMSGSNSMEAFDSMKAKVENLESQAEVAGELAERSSGATSPNMEERFRALEGNTAVEDELAKLRRQLPGGEPQEKPTPELPVTTSAVDMEYERLKKELGR